MTRRGNEYYPGLDPQIGGGYDSGRYPDRGSTRDSFSDEAWSPRRQHVEREHSHRHSHHGGHHGRSTRRDGGSYYPPAGSEDDRSYYASRGESRNSYYMNRGSGYQDSGFSARPAVYDQNDEYGSRPYDFAHTRDYNGGQRGNYSGGHGNTTREASYDYRDRNVGVPRYGDSEVGQNISAVARANVGRALWLHHAGATDNGNLACADSVSQILTKSGAANIHELSVVGLHRNLRKQGWQPDSFANRRPGDVIIATGSGGHMHAGIVGDNPGLTFDNNSVTGRWEAHNSSKWQGRRLLMVLHAPGNTSDFQNA